MLATSTFVLSILDVYHFNHIQQTLCLSCLTKHICQQSYADEAYEGPKQLSTTMPSSIQAHYYFWQIQVVIPATKSGLSDHLSGFKLATSEYVLSTLDGQSKQPHPTSIMVSLLRNKSFFAVVAWLFSQHVFRFGVYSSVAFLYKKKYFLTHHKIRRYNTMRYGVYLNFKTVKVKYIDHFILYKYYAFVALVLDRPRVFCGQVYVIKKPFHIFLHF